MDAHLELGALIIAASIYSFNGLGQTQTPKNNNQHARLPKSMKFIADLVTQYSIVIWMLLHN